MSVDEALGLQPREFGVERQHDHAVDAQPRQRPRLGFLRGEPVDDLPPGEEIGRMGLERQHGAGLAEPVGQRPRPRQHALMAPVNAVEIADGHHRALEPRRRGRGIARDDEPVSVGRKIEAHG